VNSRRTVLVAVAIVLALLTGVGSMYYLNSVQQRAYDGAELVEVWTIKEAVSRGVPGEIALEQDLIAKDQIPTEYRPATAVTDIDSIRDNVAITDLAPGQVVVEGQFVPQEVAQTTNAQRVPEGEVAVSISVDKVHGVAGLPLPGDKVNLMVAESLEEGARVETLYQNVNILAIGTKTAKAPGESSTDEGETADEGAADTGLVTFTVPLEAAQRIALVQSYPEQFTFYLTLVNPDNEVEEPKPGPIESTGVFSGAPVTPYPDDNDN
jgi:pilus assembly protein CpaB